MMKSSDRTESNPRAIVPPRLPGINPLSSPLDDELEEQLPGLREVRLAIVNRIFLVIGISVLGILVGLVLASRPKLYRSTATLRIQPSNSSALDISPAQAFAGQGGSDDKINSELAILGGRTIMLKVAGDLHLVENPDFWGTKKGRQLNISEPYTRDLVMKQMSAIVKVDRLPKSDIVYITCTTTSPALSAKIANAVTTEYLSRVFELRYGSTQRVSTWLVEQLNDLKGRVESDQTTLIDLQQKLGLLGLDGKSSAYLLADSLENVTKASSEATIGRIVAEAKLRVLTESDPSLIEGEQPLLQAPMATNSPGGLLQSLRDTRAQTAAVYANLTASLGANYPDVRQAKAKLDEVDREIDLEQRRIINQAKLSYSAASSNEKMTSKVLAGLKNEAFASHNDMVKYVIMQRQYESDRVLYESLTQRLRVAGINAGLESAQVDIIDIADVPSVAIKPLPYQWFSLSVLAFICLGIIAAVVFGFLDQRLSTPDEAERQLRSPLLSVLQKFPQTSGFGDVSRLAKGAYAEGLQLLRSSVLLSVPDHAPRVIMMTSAIPGEGKSTVSRDLAAMLAMHNTRVLLIDGDLHKPTQSVACGLRKSPGLSELLSSNVDVSDLILPVESVPGLFLLPAGKLPPQPATLLSSSKLPALLDQLKQEFDFVVLDLPPVLRVSDPVLVAPLADAVVILVREQRANRKEIRQAISLIRRAHGNIIGFVMNGVSNRGGSYSSYYSSYGVYGETETRS
jgi:succinoglycan biosynthesis transport protein ExoP